MIYVVLPVLAVIIIVLYTLKFRSKNVAEGLVISKDFGILEIQVPKDAEGDTHTSSMSAEHLFASLHGLLKENPQEQEHFTFEISSNSQYISFFITAPNNVIKYVESQVYAQYPWAKLQVSDDYVDTAKLEGKSFDVATFKFTKEDFFPIKTFRDFEVDPLSNILATFAEQKDGELIWFQMLVKPISDGWQAEGHDYVASVVEGKVKNPGFFGAFFGGMAKEMVSVFADIPYTIMHGNVESTDRKGVPGKVEGPPKLTTFQELEVSSIENKLARMGFEVVLRVVAASPDAHRVDSNLRSLGASFRQFTTTTSNEFVVAVEEDKSELLEMYKSRTFDPSRAVILNNEELATIYHLPGSRNDAPNISWVYSKTGEPPATLPTEDCTYIGETIFRGKKMRFGMKNGDDRLRHMYLIGKTGSGKSTLLNLMINQDINNGYGVGVLDPHGETIDSVLEKIPDHRVDDVVIFDPSDTERPVGLNLLELGDPSQKNLLASGLLSAIKQHFDFSWGPRLEYLLNYSLLTLLDVPGTSMLGITRLLEDQNYQKYILHQVSDPVVKRFWETEFKEMRGNQKLVTEAIAPIQNKVNRFLASTTIRNILGQRRSTIDIWDIMQNKKILLINLSKGKIGSDNANLLGALLVSRIQFMALQRAKITPKERSPFYLYVDEFQNFATGSFEEILSESRKYKLGLYLTHQYTAQLPEPLLKGVFGNVGTIASFSLGAPDAKALANEFAPYFDDEDIISLERFNIYLKMMVDGMTTLPFSAKILLPWAEGKDLVPDTGNREKILQLSREKYGTDRTYVEDVISRWVERPFDKGMAIAEEHRRNK